MSPSECGGSILGTNLISTKGDRQMTGSQSTAIVTGASKGIGAALARRLAADGFRVVVNYVSGADLAQAVVRSIQTAGGDACVAQADISDVSDIDFQRQIAINLTGAFNGMREGARRVRDGGRIISLSTSIVGTWLPAHGVYVATKAAVEAMTRVLAKELGPRGVTVNAVAPGPVATDLFLAGRSDELIRRATAEIPMGRLGEPDDIARVVSFLAGPDGGWVSGQIIRANGGRN
jgi:3-oxoacyl-[acyl-carrier protein] reductase